MDLTLFVINRGFKPKVKTKSYKFVTQSKPGFRTCFPLSVASFLNMKSTTY